MGTAMASAPRGQRTEEVVADRDWWMEFGDRFGWRLYGFTYRDGATFFVDKRETVEISGKVRTDIDTAMYIE